MCNLKNAQINVQCSLISECILYEFIGFILLYFKMAIMPLVPKTKMADAGRLISLRNLMARKPTWLVLKTTFATSILSNVFGAYYMTRIVYKDSSSNTTLFHIFTLSSVTSRENTLTLSILTNTLPLVLHLTSRSLPRYTFSVGLFPASNIEISPNHRKKQAVEILSLHAWDTFVI